ncbi:MATE family efflux transporter [Pelagicoccus sp. SDUM812003]|uniref:MATE family efflux transporter n=1 Tax=Pelagicoccus sp. SDUM812003 TaxID=3041267 RepID=UPI00281245A7|nr:MATE family efflux transporter [Pelagicoccus sp. SDUM812003]
MKATLRLAWPIVAGNLGQILIGVVDTLMIGRLGVVPLGAASFVNNIFVVPLVTLMGLLVSVTVLVAQAKGAADPRRVGRLLKHGLALALALSTVAIALLLVNASFLDRYGQEAEVVQAAGGYYWLISCSLFPALFYHCLKSGSEGMGWSNPPMLVLFGGIGLNVVLNWILIFGELGAPALGLEGAGWATLVSRIAMAGGMMAFVMRAKRFRPYLPRRWFRNYELGEWKPLLRIGVPTAMQHLFEVGAFGGAGIIVGWLGAEALAAHQVAMSCAALAFMIPLGISIACGIRVGEAFGAGRPQAIRRIYLSGLLFTFFQTLVSASVFLLLGEWIAGFFVENPSVVALAGRIFVVVGLFQIFDGAQVTCLGALRGMSDVNLPVAITFVAYWLLALPSGYGFGFALGFGAPGVWMGLALGLLVAALALMLRLRLILPRS